MPINPVQFAHGECDEFLRYLFSALPLSVPELPDRASTLLEHQPSFNIPPVRGPFVRLSELFGPDDTRLGYTWEVCWNDAVAVLGSEDAVRKCIKDAGQFDNLEQETEETPFQLRRERNESLLRRLF